MDVSKKISVKSCRKKSFKIEYNKTENITDQLTKTQSCTMHKSDSEPLTKGMQGSHTCILLKPKLIMNTILDAVACTQQ